MVARPTLSFPLASYEEEGFDIIVRGNATAVLEGDAWGTSWGCNRKAACACGHSSHLTM